MAFLELENLTKIFSANAGVRGVNLSIQKGEFISFLGPSGCGKTTTLRMVAGFETPSLGAIRIDGRDVTHLRPNQRKIGMVFQSYALFPNMTVAQNVGFGLKVAGAANSTIAGRVKEMLTMVGLPDHGDRYPYQLSGGQQQRVALARALAVQPALLLLDEPLSALDAKIRISLREEIRRVQRQLDITTIYVTHDQEEALSMSDRIVVMNEGQVEQVGTPFEIYNYPRTRFVASFVGTLNVIKARVIDPASRRISVDGQTIATTSELKGAVAGDMLSFALRPEALRLGESDQADGNRLQGTIEHVDFLGSIIRMRVRFGDNAVSLDCFNSPTSPPPAPGSKVPVSFAPTDLRLLDNG